MKRFSSMFFSILFFVFLFSNFCALPGFVEGTLVKTVQGLVPIEDIQQGNFVIACSDDGTLTKTKVVAISEKEESSFVAISLENEEQLFVSEDQKLYDPILKKWIKAEGLVAGGVLVNPYDEYFSCLAVGLVKIIEPVSFYELSLESPHTFFVSDLEIRVHNFFPAVVAVLTWTFGEAIVFEGVALAVGLAGVASVVAHKIFSDNRKWEVQVDKHAIAEKAGSCLMASSKNKAKQKAKDERKRAMAAAQSGLRPPDDEDEKKKKRIVNDMTDTEFFHQDIVKKNYRHVKDGKYQLKDKGTPLCENAEYLEWDATHNDVEVYRASKHHIGSLDPKVLKIYKGALPRKINI